MRPLRLGETDALPQGDHAASGVVLSRREGSLRAQDLTLFLSGRGLLRVGAPGADGAKNRFGGGTEPLVWGTFHLYQSPRRLYLKGVDAKEDFWVVRTSPHTLRTALAWNASLLSLLPEGLENDSLLSLLWGCMKHLAAGVAPALLDLRFAWRWGSLWGLAPSLDQCTGCGRTLDAERAAFGREGLFCSICAESPDRRASTTPLPPDMLDLLRRAGMLPRDAFAAWAPSCPPDRLKALKPYAAWAYSFLGNA